MNSFRRVVWAVATAFVAVTLSSPAAALAHVYDAPILTTLNLNASPAAAAHGPETRVRAIPTTAVDAAGQSSSETPASVGRLRPPDAAIASGSCVATKTATVRHYTTAEAAESITKAGKTIPGSSSGETWLTPDEYLDGATEQSKLALNKTPDGYFEIPMCRVSCPSSPSRVQPYNGQPGGGIEITTNSTIDVTGLPFIPFGPR